MNKYILSLLFITFSLHCTEPILFSSFFTDASKQAECREKTQQYLSLSEEHFMLDLFFFRDYLYMNPALANLRKQLMNALLRDNDRKLSQEEIAILIQNKDFCNALKALQKYNMIATYPQKETHRAVLYYYLKTLSEQPHYGLQLDPQLKNEFLTLYKSWEESRRESILKLSIEENIFIIKNSTYSCKNGNCESTEEKVTIIASKAFQELFAQLTNGKNETYVNRKALGKFFTDQLSAQEVFSDITSSIHQEKFHNAIESLKNKSFFDFSSLYSLIHTEKILVSEQEKDIIKDGTFNVISACVDDLIYDAHSSYIGYGEIRNLRGANLEALVQLIDFKDSNNKKLLLRMLVEILQLDSQKFSTITPATIQYLLKHVSLPFLPKETFHYSPINDVLVKLHEIASAGIKHYLIPLPTAEEQLTFSGQPDHKRTWKDCAETCKTHYYMTNESSPIEITLQKDGTCHVVKTVATKFAIKFYPPTAEYPETRNCLTRRSDNDGWRVMAYHEIIALPAGLEVTEWNLDATESQILKNLMQLETDKTVVTTSTNIQLFLDGFYHGLSGSTKETPAEDYIGKLQSTDFNCSRNFIYEKEGHCANERYPSAF